MDCGELGADEGGLGGGCMDGRMGSLHKGPGYGVTCCPATGMLIWGGECIACRAGHDIYEENGKKR